MGSSSSKQTKPALQAMKRKIDPDILMGNWYVQGVIPTPFEIGASNCLENYSWTNKEKKELKVDYFLPFFGLSTNLGPIKDWELELEKNILKVKQETCETNLNGIFAIGDVCSYPGKLKLILTGFAEAAIASHNCYNKINPDKTLHFEYSTTKGINKL